MKIYINLTNLMAVPFITGIQRVVIETASRLLAGDHEVILFEHDYFLDIFKLIDNTKFVEFYRYNLGEKEDMKTNKEVYLYDIEPDAIYYDIDSVWNNKTTTSYLYKKLKELGTRIICYIYDVVPIKFPHFSHKTTVYNFMQHFAGVIKYADEIFVSTYATKQDIEEILENISVKKKIKIVPLAFDFKSSRSETDVVDKNISQKIGVMGEFLLTVGTVEPRKNHKLLLSLLDLKDFYKLNKKIVIVGRAGWNSDDIQEQIYSHPEYNKNIFWFDDVDDVTLNFIYQKAYALIFPSYYEGFGLPIIEAFSKFVPVIASRVSVLEEVGGEFGQYFDVDDEQGLFDILYDFEKTPTTYISLKEKIKEFPLLTWDNVVTEIFKNFKEHYENALVGEINTSQIVILTARSEVLLDTLKYIENLIKFVEEVVIISPNKLIAEIKGIYKGSLNLLFVSDEELFGSISRPKDHLERNFLLRTLAYQRPEISSFFIAYDDDARPLWEIDRDFFIKDNKINAHYYYHLNDWHGSIPTPNSFDIGQFEAKRILEEWGCPIMSYCSHMPQVMSKRIWKEITDKIKTDNIDTHGAGEWTLFYNYGIKFYPTMFNRVKYKTLCWPGSPTDWERQIAPDEFTFENFYQEYYEVGGIFEGFSQKYNSEHTKESMKKISIRENLQKNYDAAKEINNAFHIEYAKNNSGLSPSFTIQVKENETLYKIPNYLVFKKSTNQSPLFPRIVFSILRETANTNVIIDLYCKIHYKNMNNEVMFKNNYNFESSSATRFEFYLELPKYVGEFFLVLDLTINNKKYGSTIPFILV